MQVEGYVPPKDAPELQVDKRSATPDYFRTMEIPLIAGRFFTPADTDKSQPVVLIDQKMRIASGRGEMRSASASGKEKSRGLRLWAWLEW
jgi:hypothetical protein